MGRIRKRLSGLVPVYGIFPLIMAVTVNTAVYGGSRMIAGEWHHYNIESPLDRLVPFWPPSVLIYLGCYLFWAVNYVLIARQGKKEVCQFFTADFLSRMVCLVFFLVFPTTNIRPELAQDGLWNWLMEFVYSVDAADNLFPSIHCLVSWFCYRHTGKEGDSGVVSGRFLCDGGFGLYFYINDKAACPCRCAWGSCPRRAVLRNREAGSCLAKI